jgi:hypothetical protein
MIPCPRLVDEPLEVSLTAVEEFMAEYPTASAPELTWPVIP